MNFSSCQTTTVREIATYASRPHLNSFPCIANNDGTCWEIGELRETVNMSCQDFEKWDDMQVHLERMERFYWQCKKFGKCK